MAVSAGDTFLCVYIFLRWLWHDFLCLRALNSPKAWPEPHPPNEIGSSRRGGGKERENSQQAEQLGK